MVPVRVRVKIKSLMGLNPVASIETCSLLNTGYTGASPEVILPAKLAEKLGFWPPPNEAVESMYDTAGGLARFYAIRGAALLQVVEEDVTSRELDTVISPIEREVLLSGFVIGEMGIINLKCL
ncbi:MAG: hypothetical protein QXH67_03025 [Candidatus Bathyarchaeia archaeon]